MTDIMKIGQVCEDMVWERDARYGIDSQARAENRQVCNAWRSKVWLRKVVRVPTMHSVVGSLCNMFLAALCSHAAHSTA